MAGEVWKILENNDEVYRADDLEQLQEFIDLKTGQQRDDDEEGWF